MLWNGNKNPSRICHIGKEVASTQNKLVKLRCATRYTNRAVGVVAESCQCKTQPYRRRVCTRGKCIAKVVLPNHPHGRHYALVTISRCRSERNKSRLSLVADTTSRNVQVWPEFILPTPSVRSYCRHRSKSQSSNVA
eukprot:SAG11_NODE_2577_length_3200_cov_30.456304_3_plen_137_part_00